MNETLKLESEKLARSWMQHEAGMLRDYLVSSVEDPRVNLQSILTRHFLIQSLFGDRFARWMEQECRFSAALNLIMKLGKQSTHPDELKLIQYAVRQGSDNAEGVEVPRFLLQTYLSLPITIDGITIPNYLDAALAGAMLAEGKVHFDPAVLNTFLGIWCELLRTVVPGNQPVVSVLEPACGSANDFRFIRAIGLGEAIDYTGFDLCQKNVDNALALFPDCRFSTGNVFEIPAPDKSIDLCFFHDLFEHLSPEGLAVAVREICRVTRWGICAGFFNMNEIPEAIVQPLDEYYWNTLSVDGMRQIFLRQGFSPRVLHIGTVLAQRFGCPYTHNPNAYTFILQPV